jgi:sulfur relay (sulfurtransferase) complex TusBCD TusD component (DsrE family)
VNITVIVNEAPWGSGLASAALRLAQACIAGDVGLAAAYFRDEAVYLAVPGRAADPGAPDLRADWLELSRTHGFPLLLCSSAAQRRLPEPPGEGFREAGLAEVLEMIAASDRVVTF